MIVRAGALDSKLLSLLLVLIIGRRACPSLAHKPSVVCSLHRLWLPGNGRTFSFSSLMILVMATTTSCHSGTHAVSSTGRSRSIVLDRWKHMQYARTDGAALTPSVRDATGPTRARPRA